MSEDSTPRRNDTILGVVAIVGIGYIILRFGRGVDQLARDTAGGVTDAVPDLPLSSLENVDVDLPDVDLPDLNLDIDLPDNISLPKVPKQIPKAVRALPFLPLGPIRLPNPFKALGSLMDNTVPDTWDGYQGARPPSTYAYYDEIQASSSQEAAANFTPDEVIEMEQASNRGTSRLNEYLASGGVPSEYRGGL